MVKKKKIEILEKKGLLREIFLSYLDHLKEGHSYRSFYYENVKENINFCYKTWQNYLRDYPHLFNEVLIEIAKSKGMKKWEKVVFDAALGRVKVINVPMLLSIMKNRYGWEQSEKSESSSGLNCVVSLRPWSDDSSK